MEKINTPMQELIEKIDNEIKHYEQYGNYESDAIIKGLLYARNHANDGLEKEKRVIMDAFNQGYRDGEFLEDSQKPFGDVSEHCDAEDYYNVTFKP